MAHRPLIRRSTFAAACAAAAVGVCTAPASAKENKRSVCTGAYSAYKSALEQEKAGHLHEARNLLSSCMEATACAGLVPKCAARYDQLASRMPTVVPVVTDQKGSAILDVEVKMDGAVLTTRLEGKGLPVEPGGHEFTFSTRAGVFATKQVLVVEGERNRRVEALFGSAPNAEPVKAAGEVTAVAQSPSAAPAPDEKPVDKTEAVATERVETRGNASWALPTSPLPYVVGIVGLGGVLAGGALTYWGNKDNDLAKAQCNHQCPPSTADHIRAMYIAADVSFAVGAVGLGVATWLFATSRSAEAKPPPRSAYVLDMQPTRSGGVVSVSGAF